MRAPAGTINFLPSGTPNIQFGDNLALNSYWSNGLTYRIYGLDLEKSYNTFAYNQ
jgi:hypothetical protein